MLSYLKWASTMTLVGGAVAAFGAVSPSTLSAQTRGNDRVYGRDCDYDDRRRGRDCDWDDRNRRGNDRRSHRRSDDVCFDRNHDGRCDYHSGGRGDSRARGYPRRLPDMRWGVVAARGGRVDEARQWLGRGDVRARYLDYNRDGLPEVVTWYDRRGEIIQRWIDNDRDGRADRVAFYEDGRVVNVIG